MRNAMIRVVKCLHCFILFFIIKISVIPPDCIRNWSKWIWSIVWAIEPSQQHCFVSLSWQPISMSIWMSVFHHNYSQASKLANCVFQPNCSDFDILITLNRSKTELCQTSLYCHPIDHHLQHSSFLFVHNKLNH